MRAQAEIFYGGTGANSYGSAVAAVACPVLLPCLLQRRPLAASKNLSLVFQGILLYARLVTHQALLLPLGLFLRRQVLQFLSPA